MQKSIYNYKVIFTKLFNFYQVLLLFLFYLQEPIYLAEALLNEDEIGYKDAESLTNRIDSLFTEKGNVLISDNMKKIVGITTDWKSLNTGG